MVKAVATLGFAIALLGLMNLVWSITPRNISLALDKQSIAVLGMRITGTRLLAIGAGIAITVLTGFLLARTRMGLMMRALADNREVASVLGVPIGKVETTAWSVSGALAGFTGLLFGDLVRLDPTVSNFFGHSDHCNDRYRKADVDTGDLCRWNRDRNH